MAPTASCFQVRLLQLIVTQPNLICYSLPIGETAAGSYPVDSVETMVGICDQAESDIDYRLLFQKLRLNVKPPVSVVDSISSSAVKVSQSTIRVAILTYVLSSLHGISVLSCSFA